MATPSAPRERRPNLAQHPVVTGKAHEPLLRDHGPVDPHGELTAFAGDELDRNAELELDSVRHPGGTRPVVSEHAVVNRDVGHGRPTLAGSVACVVALERSAAPLGDESRSAKYLNESAEKKLTNVIVLLLTDYIQ